MWSVMHNLKNKGSSKQLGWILNMLVVDYICNPGNQKAQARGL